MNGITARREGEHVVITVVVGLKTARLTVTRDYALAFATALMSAAGSDRPGERLLEHLEGLLHGGKDA